MEGWLKPEGLEAENEHTLSKPELYIKYTIQPKAKKILARSSSIQNHRSSNAVWPRATIIKNLPISFRTG